MDGFRGDNARAWLLQIVRHACFSWLKENRPAERMFLDDGDDSMHEIAAPAAEEPQAIAMRKADRVQINQAIAALPIAYREVLVLRELEDFSYSDIARIADIPVGTVMSRLSRARGLMREALAPSARPVLRPVPRSTYGGGQA
jgi:RNA polymerase sigma-70 factor (ECF subfamily)